MSDSDFQHINMVAEEMATYVTSLPRYSRYPTLKGVPLSRFFSDRMMVVDVISQGIPTSLFMSIKEMTPFSDQEWSDFLDISLKSLLASSALAVAATAANAARHVDGVGQQDDGDDHEADGDLVGHHLRRRAQAAEEGVLRVRSPAAHDDAVHAQRTDREDVKDADV